MSTIDKTSASDAEFQTTAGTAGADYKVEPPPIPRPRHGDDPREPGRRNTNQMGKQR